MKRFAANRVYIATTEAMYRNYVVEIDETTHQVIRTFRLEEEIRQTEWKGGIILLLESCPERMDGETFAQFQTRINKIERRPENTSLYAYHITAFDVNSMEFTVDSHILLL